MRLLLSLVSCLQFLGYREVVWWVAYLRHGLQCISGHWLCFVVNPRFSVVVFLYSFICIVQLRTHVQNTVWRRRKPPKANFCTRSKLLKSMPWKVNTNTIAGTSKWTPPPNHSKSPWMPLNRSEQPSTHILGPPKARIKYCAKYKINRCCLAATIQHVPLSARAIQSSDGGRGNMPRNIFFCLHLPRVIMLFTPSNPWMSSNSSWILAEFFPRTSLNGVTSTALMLHFFHPKKSFWVIEPDLGSKRNGSKIFLLQSKKLWEETRNAVFYSLRQVISVVKRRRMYTSTWVIVISGRR